MNWKTPLKLTDLEASQEIEVVCKRCGQSRYENPADLLKANPKLRHAYLDEIE